MGAMKASGKVLSKGGMGAAVATKQVKSAGKVTIPGLCMIKTRVKPATKAGKREMFGKMVVVKAAREDRCEGLLRCRPEEEHLSLSSSLGALSLCWLAVPSGSPAGAAPLEGDAVHRTRRDRMYRVVA